MTERTNPMLPTRFWDKVRQDGDCWVWTGSLVKDGYGRFGRYGSAHRLAYEDLRAPIPPGLVLDHLCRVPACVNPWHLEPVTDAVNIRRGRVSEANSLRRNSDTCVRGIHPWAGENIQIETNGNARCRQCHRDRARESKLRRMLA